MSPLLYIVLPNRSAGNCRLKQHDTNPAVDLDNNTVAFLLLFQTNFLHFALRRVGVRKIQRKFKRIESKTIHPLLLDPYRGHRGAKAYSTWQSQVVSHSSTNQA